MVSLIFYGKICWPHRGLQEKAFPRHLLSMNDDIRFILVVKNFCNFFLKRSFHGKIG